MSNVRKSLFLGFAQTYSSMVFQLAASMFIARLLAPAELGIYSVAAVLVGLAQILREFGIPSYIIQEKELTEERIRSAMGVAILVGWLLAAVLVLLSGPAADFYREPGVRNVMLVLALSFLLMPFGSVAMACLAREMNFLPQALASVVAAAVNCVTAVGLAFLGFSYMSLAWASVASIAVMIVFAQIYRPSHMPYLPSLKEAKRVATFGVMSESASVVGEAAQGAPDLIMGRMLNMEVVALFGRANGLVQLFDKVVMNAVWRIAMPYFSLRDRESGDVNGPFLKSVALLTALAWPFFIFLAVMAYPVIRILFGSQWDGSVPLVRYLCVAGFLTSPILLFGSVLIAIGRIRDALRAIIWIAAAQVIMVVIAAMWSVEAVAASFIAIAALKTIVSYKILQRVLGFSFREFCGSLTQSASVVVCAAVLPIVVVALLPPDPNQLWAPLLVGAFGALAGWIAGIFASGHPLREEILRAVQRVRRHRGA